MPANLAILSDVTVELKAMFTDANGDPVDPAVVELAIAPHGGQTVKFTRADGDLANPAVGTWLHRYKFTEPGGYKYTWLGDDAASDSSQKATGRVTVRSA